jgi:hypothetical protein
MLKTGQSSTRAARNAEMVSNTRTTARMTGSWTTIDALAGAHALPEQFRIVKSVLPPPDEG